MKYYIIYKIVRDEEGHVIDLINKWEEKSQEMASNWLGVDRHLITRAIITRANDKQMNETTPIRARGDEWLIMRG